MARLYPPIIPSTLPAFYGTSIDVPFTMNRTVGPNDTIGFRLRITTINGTLCQLCTLYLSQISPWLNNRGSILTFNLEASSDNQNFAARLTIGAFYKVQLAYININAETGLEETGIYSTVSTAKYTGIPNLQIVDGVTEESVVAALQQDLNDLQNENILTTVTAADLIDYAGTTQNTYVLSYSNMDTAEKIVQYRLLFFNDPTVYVNDQTPPTYVTEWQYATATAGINRFIATSDYSPSADVALIQCEAITVNNANIHSPLYMISNKNKGDYLIPSLHYYYQVEYDMSLGATKLFLHTSDITQSNMQAITQLDLYRWNQNATNTWEKVISFPLTFLPESSNKYLLYTDFFVTQGDSFLYAIQEHRGNQVSARQTLTTANAKTSEPQAILVDFEDIFLSDDERQLCVKFNPAIPSFKTNIVENKITTLGSKYPFITRNGNVNFMEIGISGLISYNMDTIGTFIGPSMQDNQWFYEFLEPVFVTKEEFEKNPTRYYQIKKLYTENTQGDIVTTYLPKFVNAQWPTTASETSKQQFYTIQTGFDRPDADKTQLSAKNVKLERLFRTEVFNWLNNGKPKVLRTPTEGNYIVQLMGVSLSPNKTVSNMIYTFSCTATEIDDYSLTQLNKYGFINNHIYERNQSDEIRQSTPHNLLAVDAWEG